MERVRLRLTRKRIVWLGIVGVVVFLLADAFVTPPAHDVHTPGAMAVKASLYASDAGMVTAVQPSESISEVRCGLWRDDHGNTPCPAGIASTYFPSVTQTSNTLYLLWTGCLSWSGSGAITQWQGYNLEYLASGRNLVVHCYAAEPWLTHHPTLFGVVAIPRASLLVIPTSAMGAGSIQVVEDDRLEHLVGDWSTEYPLATAAIS